VSKNEFLPDEIRFNFCGTTSVNATGNTRNYANFREGGNGEVRSIFNRTAEAGKSPFQMAKLISEDLEPLSNLPR
jgi:hypothetical protein